MRPFLLAPVIAILGSASLSSSAVGSYCAEPYEPFCVDGFGYFDDIYEAENCQSEVEQFVAQVEDYVSCLEDAKNEQIETANRVIEQFNCRIRGDSFC